MKTAILYLSKHGTTEKVARIIGDKLEEKDTELINLEKVQPSLDQYDRIIIGGSVYAGTVNKKLTSYCVENETLLAQKQLGLFVCGMEPDPDKQQTELETAFPKALQGKAKAIGFMGGEFILEKNELYRTIYSEKNRTHQSKLFQYTRRDYKSVC